MKGPVAHSTENLMKVRTPLRLTIYLQHVDTKEKVIKSVKDLEWRYVLAQGKIAFKVELPCVTNKTDLFGIMKMELTYGRRKKGLPKINEKDLEVELNLEKKDIAKKTAEFYELAQQYWVEYKYISSHFATRSIKIYAEDIFGALKPSCQFLRKIQCRGISSPEEAARFVYLIPFSKKEDILTRDKVWMDIDAFLTEGRGSAIEHSLLLCSLLLGFGYDAYVCIGTSSDGPHAWVFTRSEVKVKNIYKKRWRIWESLTGKILEVSEYPVRVLYSSVSCAFNDNFFYSNLQESEEVS